MKWIRLYRSDTRHNLVTLVLESAENFSILVAKSRVRLGLIYVVAPRFCRLRKRFSMDEHCLRLCTTKQDRIVIVALIWVSPLFRRHRFKADYAFPTNG